MLRPWPRVPNSPKPPAKPSRKKCTNTPGLPVAYILKANLRVNVGEFNHNLQGNDDLTTGRLDSRFSGPTIDPLAEEAAYDPQATAISSAYISGFNDYIRRQLKFGEGLTYLPEWEPSTKPGRPSIRRPGHRMKLGASMSCRTSPQR